MRLICPNCDAQYEVEDNVIPATGRDVQCSNCGHTWFQLPPEVIAEQERAAERAAEAESAETALSEGPVSADPLMAPPAAWEPAASPPPPLPDPEPVPAAAAAVPPRDIPPPAAAPEPAPESDADGEPLATAEASGLRRRSLDEAVMRVLRDEAEREARARAAEAAQAPVPSETRDAPPPAPPPRVMEVLSDPDPGPAAPDAPDALPEAIAAEASLTDRGAADAAAQSADATRDRMARMRGEMPEPAAAASGRHARRDLLPDIEEINSTLRATSDRSRMDEVDDLPEPEPVARGSGFRTGFLLVVMVALILGLTYAMAPTISSKVPVMAPVMRGYVAAADNGRAWLDAQMKRLLLSLARPEAPAE